MPVCHTDLFNEHWKFITRIITLRMMDWTAYKHLFSLKKAQSELGGTGEWEEFQFF